MKKQNWYLLLAGVIVVFAFFQCKSGDNKTKNGGKNAASEQNFQFRKLSAEEFEYYHQAVDESYKKLFGKTGFNGSILVAKNNQIVFEKYEGISNWATQSPITPNTPFHLASISKTFTAMTILHLMEQHRLSLTDSIQQYFPGFPYKGITIENLLSHRSGLPNYLYFMEKYWDKKKKASNEDVLNIMMKWKPNAEALPNKSFHYSNTNFLLLALIIEKITHQPYPQYMRDSVFMPLGMTNTFVFSIKDTANYVPTYMGSRPFLLDFLDCTYGDKNIYSTVRDLLKWDVALYENSFVSAATLDSAIIPRSHETPSKHNYGYGWRLFYNNGDAIIYHNGRWHGSNTVFARMPQDTATVIVLGNKFNRNIYKAKEFFSVFTGKRDTTTLAE